MYTVSITTQGQISIPAPLRRKLGLNTSTKAFVSEKDGKVVIEPIKDLLELGGSLKTNKKPLTREEMNDFLATSFVENYFRNQDNKDKK